MGSAEHVASRSRRGSFVASNLDFVVAILPQTAAAFTNAIQRVEWFFDQLMWLFARGARQLRRSNDVAAIARDAVCRWSKK